MRREGGELERARKRHREREGEGMRESARGGGGGKGARERGREGGSVSQGAIDRERQRESYNWLCTSYCSRDKAKMLQSHLDSFDKFVSQAEPCVIPGPSCHQPSCCC